MDFRSLYLLAAYLSFILTMRTVSALVHIPRAIISASFGGRMVSIGGRSGSVHCQTRLFGRAAASIAAKLIENDRVHENSKGSLVKRPSIEISDYESKYIDEHYTSTGTNMHNLTLSEKVEVEIKRFTPLGAVVNIHQEESLQKKVHEFKLGDIITPQVSSIPTGMVFNDELDLARERLNREIEVGERLTGYVGRISDEGQKVAILLRPLQKTRIEEVKELILKAIDTFPDRTLPIGDRSPTEKVAELFPGVTKRDFKNALGGLYRECKVKPGKDNVVKIDEETRATLLAARPRYEHKVKDPADVLFVANLPLNVTKEELKEHIEFSILKKLSKLPHSDADIAATTLKVTDFVVGSIHFVSDEDKKFKGYGFVNVRFNSTANKEKAELVQIVVSAIAESKLKTRALRCELSKPLEDAKTKRLPGQGDKKGDSSQLAIKNRGNAKQTKKPRSELTKDPKVRM
jgi:hypothetical protein